MKERIKKALNILMIYNFLIFSLVFMPLFLSCHDEEVLAEAKIQNITFAEKAVKLMVGQELAVSVICGPEENKNNETVGYDVSQGGIIEIKGCTNNGVVIRGIFPGSVVIIAKTSLVTAYLEVLVEGGDFVVSPYISTGTPVIELREGEQKTANVTLYGGSILDNYGFVWSLLPKADGSEDSISISTTANVVVIKGIKKGYQKIKVHHERAEYDNEMLIFVNESQDFVKYISCDVNVILLETGSQYQHIQVFLQGGNTGDKKNFIYEVKEGNDKINIVANNDIVNIKALESGTAVIKVTHPLAPVEFEIRVICVTVNAPFISVDKTFVMLELGNGEVIKANVENAQTSTSESNFSFEYDESDGKSPRGIIHISQANNEFYVQAVGYGLAKFIIRNNQTEYSREILIFVRPQGIYRDDYFITTSQNVIQTQVGADDIQLTMILVNGNSADANSFKWDVSDGTVIEVVSGNGLVKYSVLPESRAGVLQDVFVATAVITPVRTGVATITVSHPKSEVSASVLVKVYPKGTFVGIPNIVKTDGLIKVLKNTDIPVVLEIVSGDINTVGDISWSIDDTDIASVMDTHTITNIISGNGSGKTKLIVNGGNLSQKHESIIISGTQTELDAWKLLYVDQIFQNVAVGQTVRIPVKNSGNENLQASGYKVQIDNKESLYGVIVKGNGAVDELVIQGKQPGEARVKITHTSCDQEGITLNIRIEPSGLTLERPFYITGPEIVGVAVTGAGNQKRIEIKLEGAAAAEKGKLEWIIEDPSVVTMVANGEECYITGKTGDKQTNIIVKHSKSQNEKKIIVYTALTQEDLNNKVVIGVEKNNYLLLRGEEIFITLKTNANDMDKSGLIWSLSDSSVLSLDSNYDSARIKALSKGNAKIIISHSISGKIIIPTEIYVSVIEAGAQEKYIQGLATIEILIGESKIVPLISRNLSDDEKRNVQWNIENSGVASVQGNGDSAYILGMSRGVTYVNIAQTALGFSQRTTLLCAATKEELASMYIMGLSQTYHRMGIGEEKVIQLEFGSNGFPENERAKIEWVADSGSHVRVAGSGKGDRVTIIGLNEGIGYVDIKSEKAENKELRITFEISGKMAVNRNLRFDGFEKIKGIVADDEAIITIKIFDGETEVRNGYSLIEVKEVKDEKYITYSLADNILVVRAKPLTGTETGQSIITISHKDVVEDARILIYTANTKNQLDSMYPIAAEKKNYLIQVGEHAVINLITKDNNEMNLNKISWGITNSGIISSPVLENKKTGSVRGLKAGSTEILIQYPNSSQVVERIYISVVENKNVDFTKKIYTQNIIGLIKGQTVDTSVVTSGFTSSEEADLIWETTGGNLVEVLDYSGKTATIKAKETAAANSECYITVRYGNWLKRYILVYICENEEDVKDYKAMNMENQYIRIGKGDTVILPMYYAPNKPSEETVWEDVYGNGVVKAERKENGGKIEITGLNEGVAVLEASNNGKTNPFTKTEVYVEVSNTYTGIAQEVDPVIKFLTIGKTVFLINPQETAKQVEIQLTAIGMTKQEIDAIQWIETENPKLLKLYPSGDKCIIMSNGLEGETKIKAYHPAAGSIEIKVICDKNARIDGVTYIYFEDVVRIGINQEKQMNVSLVGRNGFNPEYFSVVCDKPNLLEVNMVGSVLFLKGKETGQAKLIIDHRDSEFKKEVLVLITTSEDGLIYLTTRDNFNLLERGGYKTIAVELVGFADTAAGNYEWELDEESRDVIELRPNGMTAVVIAKETGIGKTAKIKVIYKNVKEFPLYIYVRVSDIGILPKYITTEQNIVTIKEGQSMQIKVDMANGDPSMYAGFSWENKAKDFINVMYSGNTALITGKMAGYGRVSVSHAFSFNALDLIIIVEKDVSQSGIYITTDNLLIEMKPTDGVRSITARLVGGTNEDVYGFKWEVSEEYSTERFADGTSKKVIDLTFGADRAYVRPMNEGEAIIRVTHPKTNYRLDIKIDVQLNKKIEFRQRELTMNMGETVLLNVDSPTGSKVIYELLPSDMAVVSGTRNMCIVEGLKAGNAVLTARDVTGKLSDEIIVVVKYVEKDTNGVIRTDGNFLVLNTNDILGSKITAYLEGKDKDGKEFVNNDNNHIKWSVVPKPEKGKEIIEIFPGEGREVNIKPKGDKGGEVEIQLTHDKLKSGYVKRFYVKVEVSAALFTIDKELVVMTVGFDSADVSCSVGNVSVDYSKDIEWKIIEKPDKPPVISNMTVIGDGKTIIIQSSKEAGSAVVQAIYKGASIRTCTVIVKDRLLLDLPVSVRMLKGEKVEVPVKVNPVTSNIEYMINDGNMIITRIIYGNEDTNGGIATRNGNNILEITAEENGITSVDISLLYDGGVLKKTIQVIITAERDFQWLDNRDIRILPTNNELTLSNANSYEEGKTIKYKIETKQINNVSLIPTTAQLTAGSPYQWQRKPFLLEREIGSQEIKLKYFNNKRYFEDGIYEIQVVSNIDNSKLSRKIYIYYPVIEFDFKLEEQIISKNILLNDFNILKNNYWNISNNNFSGYSNLNDNNTGDYKRRQMYSRVESNRAIYISDGERLELKVINLEKYPGNSFEIKGKNFKPYNNLPSTSLWAGECDDPNGLVRLEEGKRIFIEAKIKDKKIDGNEDVLIKREYLGVLEISYAYFNGGEEKKDFVDKYLVFGEIRNRKKL